eukprot:Blabericola_migrator_1__2156@NODE_1595_length_4207_cov_18_682367_g1043_i0_p1_GENE_NODE_1595_length_4207_cov_18_682367_g1043_i0NODE_1595_length_4207_cov_18_682367_g1043_i0_p1_ORF_typecomplete_len409_score28_95Peptidase_S8/PF00082_22/3_4e10Peptidase_S8_N/PF16361_5/0_056_NODE_1595_length_4207_cov_18_682367_g1043_i016912917
MLACHSPRGTLTHSSVPRGEKSTEVEIMFGWTLISFVLLCTGLNTVPQNATIQWYGNDALWKTAEYLTALLGALERAKKTGHPLNIIFQFARGELEEVHQDIADWDDKVVAWGLRRRRRHEFCMNRLLWLKLKPDIKCNGDERCEGLAREIYISRELEFGIISFLDTAFSDRHKHRLYHLLRDVICHPRIMRIGLDEIVTRAGLPDTQSPAQEFIEHVRTHFVDDVAARARDEEPADNTVRATSINTSCLGALNPYTPNDPKYGQQWHLSGINAPAVWPLAKNMGTGNPIALVIDSGTYVDHPDLKANLYTNTAEANGQAGVDDDGNGYIDDVHGVSISSGTVSGDVDDEDGHGTFCAGEIAAVSDNGVGVAGLATRTKVATCKFFGTGVSIDSSYLTTPKIFAYALL